MVTEPRRRWIRAAGVSLAAAVAGVFLLLEACFGPIGPPPLPPPAELSYLASPVALTPFFAALEARKAHPPVRILQIGDSHTANDSLSGRLRERFQQKFGAAGRGWLPAGIPSKYYRPALVSVGESGWRHVRPGEPDGLPLGLDAVAAENEPPDATMAIESTETAGFDRFAVEFLTRPNGPAFTVAVDGGAPIRVSTAAATAGVKLFDLPLDRPARRVELHAEGRAPVALLGWAVERHTSGVIYENHGTIGATIDLIGRMSPDTMSFELADRRPALLVVAFGTNEGFDDGLDPGRYAARFTEHVAALRRAASGAPVLVIGPPDGNRVAPGCAATSCGAPGGDCAWHEPARLAAVRDAQQRAAAREGWAYWDWFAAMGGVCSIDRLASADPPLAERDHVHLKRTGYETMADRLFGDVMREYEKWKSPPRSS